MQTKMNSGRDNKNLNIRSAQLVVLMASLPLFVVGCGKVDLLKPLAQYKEQSSLQSKVGVKFCTDPAYEQKQYLKTIIILDHSGSNQENYLMATDGSGAPALDDGKLVISKDYATDPTGVTRYGTVATKGTLLNYLANLPANDPNDPTRFFALVNFNSTATTYPAGATGFTSDIPGFSTYVQADAIAGMGNAPADAGGTGYKGALSAAYAIMNSDIQAATNCAALPLGSPSPGAWCPTPGKQIASSYVIVFMSDGSPITNVSGIGIDASGNVVVTGAITITKEPAVDILGLVSAMVALTSNAKYVTSVNLFTVYYYFPGNIDYGGQSILANMAKVGNGIAYNALGGSNIDYNQFQPPKKRIKYALADIFVTNSSVNWWNDGTLHADTDRDGLPDDVEKSWGSDSTLAQTDGNGVSDLVKYQLSSGAPCVNKNATGICVDPAINYATGLCTGVATVAVPGRPGAINFTANDPSGLNNCEKIILGNRGGIGNPDSNSDFISDWLQFKNGIPFQLGSAPAINVPNQDGSSTYQKIKLSLPINVPSTQFLNFVPATYNLNLISTTDVQDCYDLAVTNLPTLGGSDTIRVDVIQKSELLRENILYRVAHKTFTPGSTSLQFNDWKDSAEKAAGTWSVWP